MIQLSILFFVLFAANAEASTWKLSSGSLEYTLKHMLHTVSGKSTEVKGIGKCDPKCSFLVAAPVKSFGSDNSNRDSNMQVYTKAAANPMVELRTNIDPSAGTKNAEIEIKLAGKSHSYNVPISFTPESGGFLVHAIVPMNLSDFDIERPALLGVACENAVPVTADLHIQSK